MLQPRTKGFVATVQALRDSHVKHVYDLTLSYRRMGAVFGMPPSLIRSFTGDLSHEFQFHVDVKRFAMEDLPLDDDEALADWLRQRFIQKDQFLSQMQEHWTAGLLALRSEP